MADRERLLARAKCLEEQALHTATLDGHVTYQMVDHAVNLVMLARFLRDKAKEQD